MAIATISWYASGKNRYLLLFHSFTSTLCKIITMYYFLSKIIGSQSLSSVTGEQYQVAIFETL